MKTKAGELIDLEGVKVAKRDACFFSKIPEINEILQDGMAATRGEYNGAINIWLDDLGQYRITIHRNFSTIGSLITNEVKEMESYVKKWIKKIK